MQQLDQISDITGYTLILESHDQIGLAEVGRQGPRNPQASWIHIRQM
ncbi:hypothetical protein GCM10011395_35790 [Sphingomonas psychrolutea]|uniref:Uncharacterized protein n=1 Tax=Sphingomonas psychrolutea TaxID=1259676 RepID=A0ABQ1H8G2_9SPHN|nr:hypothetical protein GCM10011395_35790 [Sphingomonas psychrolutea]